MTPQHNYLILKDDIININCPKKIVTSKVGIWPGKPYVASKRSVTHKQKVA